MGTQSYAAPAAGYAVRLVTLLSDENQAIGISEIARKLNLNKNMVSRLLSTLVGEGWVCEEERSKYRLTLLPFQVTSRMTAHMDLTVAAHNCLYELWRTTDDSTYLAVLHKGMTLYLEHYDCEKSVRVAGTVGGSYPLYCTAPGKVLLAYSSDSELINSVCSSVLLPHTEKTIITGEKLRAELEIVRKNGYATDVEEFGRGIVCLAAPVFDRTGKVCAAVGCSSSTVYCEPENIVAYYGEAVCRTAREISRKMGAPQYFSGITQDN